MLIFNGTIFFRNQKNPRLEEIESASWVAGPLGGGLAQAQAAFNEGQNYSFAIDNDFDPIIASTQGLQMEPLPPQVEYSQGVEENSDKQIVDKDIIIEEANLEEFFDEFQTMSESQFIPNVNSNSIETPEIDMNNFGSKDPLPDVFKKLYISQTTIKEIVKPKKRYFELIEVNKVVF